MTGIYQSALTGRVQQTSPISTDSTTVSGQRGVDHTHSLTSNHEGINKVNRRMSDFLPERWQHVRTMVASKKSIRSVLGGVLPDL